MSRYRPPLLKIKISRTAAILLLVSTVAFTGVVQIGSAAAAACDHPANALDVNVAAGGDIQAAIDRVAAAGGGCVNLAAGSWTISQPLQLRTKVALNGAGSATVLYGPSSAYRFQLLVVTGAEPRIGVTVENLVIDGKIPPSALTTDPNVSNPYDGAAGIYFGSFTTDDRATLIKNVEVKHAGMGIHVKGVTGLTMNNVRSHTNGIAYWTSHNVYLRRASNVTIVNSMFNDALVGVGLHMAGGGDHISISNSTFSGNAAHGINIQDTPSNVTIRSVGANGNHGDGIRANGTNLLIDANHTLDNTAAGIYTPGGNGSITNNISNGNSPDYNIHGTFTTSNNS